MLDGANFVRLIPMHSRGVAANVDICVPLDHVDELILALRKITLGPLGAMALEAEEKLRDA